MAGIGEWNTLSNEDLQASFQAAAEAGHDFLLKVSHTSVSKLDVGAKWGSPGAFLDMIDFYETAEPVRKESLRSDLLGIYNSLGTLHVLEVYDLHKPFEESKTELPDNELQFMRAEIAKAEKHFEWEAKNPIVRFFTKEPPKPAFFS